MWQDVHVHDKVVICTSEDEYPEYQEMNGAIGTVRRVHACAIVFVEFDNQNFRDQTFDPSEYRVLTPIERVMCLIFLLSNKKGNQSGQDHT